MAVANARTIMVSTLEECQVLKDRIDAGEDFAAMAKQYSKCPSGRDGGDIGNFRPGQMIKEIDEVAFCAEVGKTHGPITTQNGFYLLQILERKDGSDQ